MGTHMKRIIMAIAAVSLGLAGLAGIITTPAQACGGNYPATVKGDTGQGVTYCSDGTIEAVTDLAPEEIDDAITTGDGTATSCGDAGYPASVETQNVETGPGQSVSYCSDGTLDGVQNPPQP